MTQLEFDKKMQMLNLEQDREKEVFTMRIDEINKEQRDYEMQLRDILAKIAHCKDMRTNCLQAIKEINSRYYEQKHQLIKENPKTETKGVEVKWCRMHVDDVRPLPQYETEGAAGMDISAWLKDGDAIQTSYIEGIGSIPMLTSEFVDNDTFHLIPRVRALIPTGWKVQLPKGYEMQLRPRSGNAIKLGLSFVNCVGTIDSDYRGEVMVEVINHSEHAIDIKDGMKIAQAIIAKVPKVNCVEVEELDETDRGEGGFGSTDKPTVTPEETGVKPRPEAKEDEQ